MARLDSAHADAIEQAQEAAWREVLARNECMHAVTLEGGLWCVRCGVPLDGRQHPRIVRVIEWGETGPRSMALASQLDIAEASICHCATIGRVCMRHGS